LEVRRIPPLSVVAAHFDCNSRNREARGTLALTPALSPEEPEKAAQKSFDLALIRDKIGT